MPPSDAAIADYHRPLTGIRLPADTLPELVRSEKMLILHFLRHLGCLFCKHSVDKLHRLAEQTPNLPRIVFVHQSSPNQGEAFFNEYFPGTSHISDPQLGLYKLFDIQRMSNYRVLDPRQILNGFKALFAGHVQYETLGDPNILSGTFLFFRGRLVWSHYAKFAGDEPRWDRLGSIPGQLSPPSSSN